MESAIGVNQVAFASVETYFQKIENQVNIHCEETVKQVKNK